MEEQQPTADFSSLTVPTADGETEYIGVVRVGPGVLDSIPQGYSYKAVSFTCPNDAQSRAVRRDVLSILEYFLEHSPSTVALSARDLETFGKASCPASVACDGRGSG